MTVEAYPLHWPPGVPRTEPSKRQRARFSSKRADGRWNTPVSMSDARRRLEAELRPLNAAHVVVSTNVALRRDGWPYANQNTPDDTGAAVYYSIGKEQLCHACDRWDRPEDNIAAIAAIIGALRGIDRWGNGHAVKAAFDGFKALSETINEDWRSVLQVPDCASLVVAKKAYRLLASRNHPDKGGSEHQMARINQAWADAQEALSA